MTRDKSKTLPFILLAVLLEVIWFGIILPIVPTLLIELGSNSIGDAAMGGYLLFVYAALLFIFGPVVGDCLIALGVAR